MYYECTECGQMLTLSGVSSTPFVEKCPNCDELTQWTLAFEGEGVSF